MVLISYLLIRNETKLKKDILITLRSMGGVLKKVNYVIRTVKMVLFSMGGVSVSVYKPNKFLWCLNGWSCSGGR